MTAGSRHQNPLATMLCKFKAKAAGGRAQRSSRRAVAALFPCPDKYFGARRAIQASIQPRRAIPAPIRLKARPRRVEQTIARESPSDSRCGTTVSARDVRPMALARQAESSVTRATAADAISRVRHQSKPERRCSILVGSDRWQQARPGRGIRV